MIVRRVTRTRASVRHVAAYARVSTLSEEQEESYETQVKYYTDLIRRTGGWKLAGIYADPGITGTDARRRPQFMQMIRDAKAGQIDLILCKSVSRFSRNFRDAQAYVHELKAANVEVRFEKEGISSFDPNADLVFSAMAAIAQEESRSISENVKWSYRRMAEKGIRHVGSNHMLGYDEIDGRLTPNADAWIVRLMFEEYAAGVAPKDILGHLNERGAQRMRSSKRFVWSIVLHILKNEAYVGDRLIQKHAPHNFLTKRPDPNVPYDSRYIRDDHEAIVTRAVWEAAQERLKNTEQAREKGVNRRSASHFLYGKVFCAACGAPYRRQTVKRGEEHRKRWRCNGQCGNGSISEEALLAAICAKMRWEKADEALVSEHVEKVLVGESGVTVIRARKKGGRKAGKPEEAAGR